MDVVRIADFDVALHASYTLNLDLYFCILLTEVANIPSVGDIIKVEAENVVSSYVFPVDYVYKRVTVDFNVSSNVFNIVLPRPVMAEKARIGSKED